jgi:hypothetical protein
MYATAQGIEAYVYEDKIEDADAGVLVAGVVVGSSCFGGGVSVSGASCLRG